MTSRLTTVLGVLTALATTLAAAQENERILDFHADIAVQTDASLDVTETIEVYAAGNQIKRGIYRDLPYHGLQPRQVLMNGRSSPYHTTSYGDGTRIYIGDKDVFLSPGDYTYTIQYRIPLEVRFFDENDQVYWNVTGNQWAFPIESAFARIVLPQSVDEANLIVEGWTGPERSTEQNYEAHVAEPGVIEYKTTAPLGPREGLTIRVSIPKGIVDQPTKTDLAATHLRQLGFTGVESAAIGAIFLYLLVVWAMFGKDPSPGRVLPTDKPPDGFSPALCRYIKRMGYDQKAFTAALVSMATKGYLRIEQDDEKVYTIVRDTADDSVLSRDERALAGKLLKNRTELALKRTNRSTIQSAMSAFQKSLKRENEKEYFKTNSIYLWPSFIAGVAAVMLVAFTNGVHEVMGTVFLCIWLSVWTMAVTALGGAAIERWVDLIRAPGVATLGSAIGGTLFFGVFGVFECVAVLMLTKVASLGFAVTLVAIAVLHVVFYQLLKTPTSLGRRFLDKLDGFEMYIEGKDSLQLSGAEAAARFDRYLPFAIALGRDADWTHNFELAAQAATTSQSSNYSPRWYTTSIGHAGSTAFLSGLGASLSSAVASASTSSSSSGGGGGGSSGGGGGGGGGGGW